jgi:hypothetical protein
VSTVANSGNHSAVVAAADSGVGLVTPSAVSITPLIVP